MAKYSRIRDLATVSLGTHDGPFHSDDVNAYVLLSLIFEKTVLVRSRDSKVLDELDIVFDVNNSEYDHHDPKSLKYRENGIPYSSFGLLWQDFGIAYLEGQDLTKEMAQIVFKKFDEKYVQGIDALDNGIEMKQEVMSVSSLTELFYPSWDSEEQDFDAAFFEAAKFVKTVFLKVLNSIISKEKAVDLVVSSFENRENKEILELKKSCPWKEILLDIDKEEEIKFTVFPTVGESELEYRLQVIPKNKDTFEARKDLPKQWSGKRDKELNELVGIEDGIFCHKDLFIAGAKSRNSILKMADLALKE